MIKKRLKLTTRVNIQVIILVSLFMLVVTAYGQWTLFIEKKQIGTKQLRAITQYFVNKMPDTSFTEMVERQGAKDKSAEEQVMAINKELQPIIGNALVAEETIKFGYYSLEQESIVAIGPVFDRSLLVRIHPTQFSDMYETQQPQLGEYKHSIVWYGAEALYYQIPISKHGKVIGHAFAQLNLNKVRCAVWRQTINVFLGGFVALLIVIMLFQEVFIRLKKDLTLFAEQIVKGRAKYFESELPELTPIFKYISEQAEKMAGLDRMNLIGEMAASIGHEVRNPMTTVRGFLQFLGDKPELANYREHLQLMIEELDRANSIITEFLSLAKNHVMNFQKANLNKVIDEILPLLQADALRNGSEISVELGEIPDVIIDTKSIRQLILNMVRNAIEAMPGGGVIKITTRTSGQAVLLSIKDHGIGIPSELFGILGTPFMTTKEKGTGLGLAVCYRIAQRHDAAIAVKSEPGKGTTFTIEFKFAE